MPASHLMRGLFYTTSHMQLWTAAWFFHPYPYRQIFSPSSAQSRSQFCEVLLETGLLIRLLL